LQRGRTYGYYVTFSTPQSLDWARREETPYRPTLQAKADALKRFQAETTAELDALLPSILDRAFRGEL
jgi:hypothetical protein